jgi:hypothetical protein
MEKGLRAAAFGQVSLINGSGQVEWLLPVDSLDGKTLPALIDNLCLESGLRGAKFLTASAPADSDLFEFLRRSGFSSYSWEAFWEMDKVVVPEIQGAWLNPSDTDAPAVAVLQKKLIPPVVQAVRQIRKQALPESVFQMEGKILGLMEVSTEGSTAVFTPVLSQDVDNPAWVIAALVNEYLADYERVYLRQTGSASWLTAHLDEIAHPVIERQELLIKHFTVRNKVSAAELNTATNPRHADPAVPFARSSSGRDHL